MKVRKHKRVNKGKDDFCNIIKVLAPNSFICRTQLSIFIKIANSYNKKIWYGDNSRFQNHAGNMFHRTKTHIVLMCDPIE